MELKKTTQNTTFDDNGVEQIASVSYNIKGANNAVMGQLNVHKGGFSMNVTREFGSVEEMTAAIQSALNEMYKEEV